MEIRLLQEMQELATCEELQLMIWGRDERFIAGRNLLKAVITAGGLLAGCYDGKRLVGFVYGFFGKRRGEWIHWSHMLGVRTDYRSKGIGEKLKKFQKQFVLKCGVNRIQWTFDPLQAGNTYFNLHKLKVYSCEYLLNHYGEMYDKFNWGIATDRLVATWDVGRKPKRSLKYKISARDINNLSILLEMNKEDNTPSLKNYKKRDSEKLCLIEVPPDINSIKTSSISVAQDWRLACREVLQFKLQKGYAAVDFLKTENRGFIVLQR